MIERLCSLAEPEFRRHLPLALRGFPWQQLADGSVAVALGPGRALVTIEPVAPLRLSPALALPRLRVAIAFDGCSPAGRDAFIAAWDRAFQRGGG
jgi:hypothetical protein